ncbi:Hypothetical predicted protein [Mytilus galloprovincialis]|uniref:Uncharacterized protein n=1 Tax=Mytilus galloprovincialis TaxID=29158 RepID=A0A8B6DYK0_MYTGA|nr:Hypothetical predicted protein [Mytilus galloprovincialis]
MGKNKYKISSRGYQNAVQMVEKSQCHSNPHHEINVPKTTIIDKLNGRSSLQGRSGPSPVLCDSEEEMLVHWVIKWKNRLWPKKQQLRIRCFRIYNADESGFSQDPKSGKILAAKGSKMCTQHVQLTITENSFACMSDSTLLPPMLVFPGSVSAILSVSRNHQHNISSPCHVNEHHTKDTNKTSQKKHLSSLELLLVTPSEQKTLKKRKTRTVLPKAVSGSEMIKILEIRKQQKEDEQEMKEKRKIDRELKRKQKKRKMLKRRRRKTRKRKGLKKIRNVNYPKNKRNRRNRLLPGFVPSVYLKQTMFRYVARFAPRFTMQNALVLTFLVCILTTSLAFHMSVMIASKKRQIYYVTKFSE